MELIMLNEKFETVDLIDTFESLIWTERYDEAGDFELYIPMSESQISRFNIGWYLMNKDSDKLMIIENITIASDIEEGNHITISGQSVESILKRRVIWNHVVYNGSIQDIIHDILNRAIIMPEIPERRIDNFIFKETTDPRITNIGLEVRFMGENVYEVINTLCVEFGIGFKITLNDYNQFVFELYMGANRSYAQSDNPYVIFSPSFDNIINSNYYESNQDYKNVVLVGGQGEDADKTTNSAGTGSGLERREMYVEATDIPAEDDTVPNYNYMQLLQQRGLDELSKTDVLKAFEGEVEATRMFKYGIHFYIGDVVQIANEYGHEDVTYVSEYVMTQNESGISMYPTFKKWTHN